MKRKKIHKDLIIILISLIIIGLNNVSLSKYDYMASAKSGAQIAKGIVTIEKDETIKQVVDRNSFPIEYNFSVNNYKEDTVNEVDFYYTIEVEASVGNFPVSYVLLDCDNNVQIELVNGKSKPMQIKKFIKDSRKFKLYLQWRQIDRELAKDVKLNLKVNAVQAKESE